MALTEKGFGKPEIDNGIAHVKYAQEDAYFKEAEGADIDSDTLKKVAKFNKTYIDEATAVSANYAKDLMLDKKDVDRVVTAIPYSTSTKGAVEVITTRSVTTTIPGTDRKVTKSGVKVAVTDPMTKATKASVNKLKASLTESLLS